MGNKWGKNGNSDRLYLSGTLKSLQMVIAAIKLKDACSLEKRYNQPRQHIKKQRHYFADKGLFSQGYGFSSSHVWMEKAMEPHSSTLAWKIPWMEEPGRLQSMGSLRVGHDWVTSLSCIGEGDGNPLQCSCLENPRDGGDWWAAIYGVAQSRTRLKQLSSSSSSSSNHLPVNVNYF